MVQVTSTQDIGQRYLGGTRLRAALIRLGLSLAGAGLLVGFFMPWVGLGEVVSVSGFSLMMSEGEVLGLLSGSARLLLLAVPLLGLALLVGAFSGQRWALWVALGTSVVVLGYGLVSLVRLFLQTTGLGLWVVVGCAFLALTVALVSLGREA